ncbi:hypothetical protein C6W10_20460 [Plantactinospora sp. BB1]|nr:hypothetical protein C6W10_20460 [Plantactinospora sp. BB1]
MPIEQGATSSATARIIGAPIMSLTLDPEGTTIVLGARGEVDMSNADGLVTVVERLAGGRPLRLVLDLSAVTFFSAHGVSALLRARTIVTGTGGELVLRDISRTVEHVLTLTGVHPGFGLESRSCVPGADRPDVTRCVAGHAVPSSGGEHRG